jgi:phosphinothricin acetyltransferase
LELRPGRVEDLPALVAIYNAYVDTAITFDVEPFSVETRRPWFEQFAPRGRHRLIVATDAGGESLGYACSARLRPKAAYDPSVETSIYLAPDCTGRGIGRRLYAALFAALADEDVHRAYAAITLPNPASLALHEKLGFARVGLMREVGFKLGRWWDVAWYEKPLP